MHSFRLAGATEARLAGITEVVVQALAVEAAEADSRAATGDLAAAAPEQPPVSRTMQVRVVALPRQHHTLETMHLS